MDVNLIVERQILFRIIYNLTFAVDNKSLVFKSLIKNIEFSKLKVFAHDNLNVAQ